MTLWPTTNSVLGMYISGNIASRLPEERAKEFRKITADITVSPQISADHLQAIATAGCRSIICNRPDGEGADGPAVDDIFDAERANGIETRIGSFKFHFVNIYEVQT